MRFHAARPGYDVLVRGTFVDPSRFEVLAVVQHDRDLSEPDRGSLLREARLEVMLAILRESERGRRMGARRVFVVVDGDDELADLFRGDGHGASAHERTAPPARSPWKAWARRVGASWRTD